MRVSLELLTGLRDSLAASEARVAQLTAALEKIATPSGLELTEDTTQEDQTDFWHRASYTKVNIATAALTPNPAPLEAIRKAQAELRPQVNPTMFEALLTLNHAFGEGEK